ncbi:hypothetical protein IMX26_03315 [Clostridium sp. 'deep sea']|uniref:hypothetical protein n=1 Tax=Clostridium sp. 'deep sea' TaxID=2779445 RepID=UPI0018967A94|nr:hypothetical protein [Clostridium sp. 'deep sea']QOR35863.1 hypothetical protein IMX26_03315 [Clostridium sp. 'deep sea']
MIITTVLAILFFIVGISNAMAADMFGFYSCLFVAFVLVALVFYINNEKKKIKSFIEWVTSNKYYIEQGVAEYNGNQINLNTKISSYVFCVSALFFTQVMRSRIVIKGTFEAVIMKIVNILLTILFGLWAFPRGPIYVVILTIKNISGGTKMTIKDLIEQIEDDDHEIEFTSTAEYQKIKEQRYRDSMNY